MHLDYYQQVARQALEQAIVIGDRPESMRYRVRFGRGIGKGKIAGKTGGYQSVVLPTDDFVIDILDRDGNDKVAVDETEQKQLDRIRKKISVGLRGSSQDRFRVVDEGLMLYGAFPKKEKAPGSWQGPSPNVKLEMQRVFAERGDLMMRVVASRGYLPPAQQQVLVALEDPQPLIEVLGNKVRVLMVRFCCAPMKATTAKTSVSMGPVGANRCPQPASARLRFRVPEDGFYQIDFVHSQIEAGKWRRYDCTSTT